MTIERGQFRTSDLAYLRAFDRWKPGHTMPNIFTDWLSPDEIRTKVGTYRAVLDQTLVSAKKRVEPGQDWDVTCFQVFTKIQSAALYYLFTRDRRAMKPALDGLEALERCERPYWTYSSCLGVLDMDLRTAEAALSLATMKCCMGEALGAAARRRLARLVVDRCLGPGLEAERNKTYPWMHSRANWRLILCGCFAIGGMAFADECPDYRELIEYGIEAMLSCFATGDRAGGWNEGPGYWDYGLGYAVAFSRGLRVFTGGQVDLFRHPFLRKTGDFRLFMHTRPDEIWNWSDAGKKTGPSITLLGLARAYRNPTYQWLALAQGLKTIGQLYNHDPSVRPEQPATEPVAKRFPGLGVLVWREGFGPRDAYIGVKAGDIPHFNHHCHLDFGNVVIHAAGRELLAELDHWPYPYEGRKDPKVKGYQPGLYDLENKRWMRWDLDDVAATGHNLVTLEGLYPQASIGVRAKIKKAESGSGYELAIVDCTPPYRPLATRVRRYIVYLRPDVVLLVDEVRARKPVRARVQFHPAASVTCGTDSFTFTNGPASLVGTSLCPRAEDHLVLGLDDRRTSYHPPAGLVEKRHRYVYLENLWRKPRVVFVTALQFGRKSLTQAEFALQGQPAAEDAFGVRMLRGDPPISVHFNLAEVKVEVTT